MNRLIIALLVALSCLAFPACGGDKDTGELCASDEDCESGHCDFGPCPDSGPSCQEGEDCLCLVCQ